jgi:hypothetical protein
MNAFVRWVARQPFHDEPKLNAHYCLEEGGGGGRRNDGDDEDDDEDDD